MYCTSKSQWIFSMSIQNPKIKNMNRSEYTEHSEAQDLISNLGNKSTDHLPLSVGYLHRSMQTPILSVICTHFHNPIPAIIIYSINICRKDKYNC